MAIENFVSFQTGIEGGVHGVIHCAVGNRCLAPLIGLPPFAAADPVFWHHHANIDRLFECWMAKWKRKSDPSTDPRWKSEEFPNGLLLKDWLAQEYVFPDENGNRATMKVSELFDPTGRIDYTYDNVSQCSRYPDELTIASLDTVAAIELPGQRPRKSPALPQPSPASSASRPTSAVLGT